MEIHIIAVTKDSGKLKDGRKWEGTRLVIQEVSDNGDARTCIAKATNDFPTEGVSSAISDYSCLVVSRLLYDRFGRVVGYDLD